MSVIWLEEPFQYMVGVILAFLLIIATFLFFSRDKGIKCKVAWASVKSWLLVTPLILFIISLPQPYILFGLVLTSIYAIKTFFCIVGMYHLKAFVLTSYFFIALTAYCIKDPSSQVFSLQPFIPICFLISVMTISLIKKASSYILQYTALSLLAFMLFGWCFMHIALILQMEKGVYVILSLYILSEVHSLTSLSFSRFVKTQWLKNQNQLFNPKPKDTELLGTSSDFQLFPYNTLGFMGSLPLTFALSWGLHQFSHTNTVYWVGAALVVVTLGTFGSVTFNFFRRNLTMKTSKTPFIFNRDDILSRLDKIIFIAPVFYYYILLLDPTAGKF